MRENTRAGMRRAARRACVLELVLSRQISQEEIAEELDVDQKTVSNDIAWLVEQGLIIRLPPPADITVPREYAPGPNTTPKETSVL